MSISPGKLIFLKLKHVNIGMKRFEIEPENAGFYQCMRVCGELGEIMKEGERKHYQVKLSVLYVRMVHELAIY
jgi:hypothetical protein